jgi:pentatricopeptide repeat protein
MLKRKRMLKRKLNQLIDNYPNNKNLYEMKANYYLSQKDTIKALEVFNKMEELN